MAPLASHILPPPTRASDDDPGSSAQISPESSLSNARLTPSASGSDDSDVELDEFDKEAWEDVEAEEGRGRYEGRGMGSRRRRGSFETTQSYELYTPDEERAVVRKFDRNLVLFVAFLYMLSFLDRSNIGNAKIAGLDLELGLDSAKYEWVITAFYIAYICFEWMSVLWKIIPAHIYVTAIVLSWGIVASLQSIVTSFAGLLVLRTLLGIGEAGFSGVPFYLSFFFKRDELALRTGFFIAAAPLATSFASTLAWVIIKLGNSSPIASWRLLFLLEGFPSVLVAVIAWNLIPDSPSTASYLTKREKRVARLRLRKSHHDASQSTPVKSGLNIKEMLEPITDPKSYLTAIMFFCTNMAFSSMPVFLPTIIHEMGHTVVVSQALSAPPYLLSFFVVILTAFLSDRWQNRSYFVVFHALLSAFGYGLMAVAGERGWATWVRYMAIYPAAVGFFSVITIIITWTINNQESESSQGTGFAMLQLIGQCGPLLGTRLYPQTQAPLYTQGMTTCAFSMMFVACLALALRIYLGKINRSAVTKYNKIESEGQSPVADSGGAFKFML